MLIFQIILWGTVENTATIAFIDSLSISPRIEPKDTSITPLPPPPFINSSRSSGSGLAGPGKSGPTDFTSEKKEQILNYNKLLYSLIYNVKHTINCKGTESSQRAVYRKSDHDTRNDSDLKGSYEANTINSCVLYFFFKIQTMRDESTFTRVLHLTFTAVFYLANSC